MSDPIDAAMAAVRRRIASPAWADDFSLPAPVGTELDGLDKDLKVAEWSAERHATLQALRAIRPVQKLAVLAMAKNEALHLPEWIAHYRAIGADKIFIYTNDSNDGTDDVLRWFANCSPVVPIFTKVTAGTKVPRKNYAHALFMLPQLRLYEWVIVVDLDEFLVPGAQYGHHLPTMLAAAPADTSALLFPWRWRLWKPEFERTPGLLAERFPHAGNSEHCKSVVRLAHVNSLYDIHVPRLKPGSVLRYTDFGEIPPDRVWGPDKAKTDKGGWIDHYWGRSFEEFIIKKERGANMMDAANRQYDNYFDWTARLTRDNHSPVPEPLLSKMKRELERFQLRPGYAEMMRGVEERFARHALETRNDAEKQRIFAAGSARYFARTNSG